MVEESDNKIALGQVVYTFASPSMARTFEACLAPGALATCKERWWPTGI